MPEVVEEDPRKPRLLEQWEKAAPTQVGGFDPIMSLTEGSFGGPGRVFEQMLQRCPGGLFGHLCALAGTALSDTDPLKGRLAVSAISQIGMDDTRAAAIT